MAEDTTLTGFIPAQIHVSPELEAMAALLATAQPGVSAAAIELGELVVHASREVVPALMLTLRDDERFGFEQLMDLCGVDWPERAERFDVVYNLLSVSRNLRVRVIVRTDEATPVPSVHEIWPCATWWEREAWDLFGILFAGQPDHRRILTDYGFEGHPLRKDFPLTGHVEVRYDFERKDVVYEQVRLPQDFRNFDFVSPWEGMVTLPGDEKAHLARMGRPQTAKPPGIGSVPATGLVPDPNGVGSASQAGVPSAASTQPAGASPAGMVRAPVAHPVSAPGGASGMQAGGVTAGAAEPGAGAAGQGTTGLGTDAQKPSAGA